MKPMLKIALLVFICAAMAACSGLSVQKPDEQNREIITTFGDQGLARMKEFVDRFNESKGDYLLVIPPRFDSGYEIYDLFSDGNTIRIRRDMTRDMYSAVDNQVTEYACSAAQLVDTSKGRQVEFGQCSGSEAPPSFTLFVFNEKE